MPQAGGRNPIRKSVRVAAACLGGFLISVSIGLAFMPSRPAGLSYVVGTFGALFFMPLLVRPARSLAAAQEQLAMFRRACYGCFGLSLICYGFSWLSDRGYLPYSLHGPTQALASITWGIALLLI